MHLEQQQFVGLTRFFIDPSLAPGFYSTNMILMIETLIWGPYRRRVPQDLQLHLVGGYGDGASSQLSVHGVYLFLSSVTSQSLFLRLRLIFCVRPRQSTLSHCSFIVNIRWLRVDLSRAIERFPRRLITRLYLRSSCRAYCGVGYESCSSEDHAQSGGLQSPFPNGLKPISGLATQTYLGIKFTIIHR